MCSRPPTGTYEKVKDTKLTSRNRTTNTYIQNYWLRQSAGLVPTADAILSNNGVYYDEAYDLYMSYCGPNVTHDPTLEAQLKIVTDEQALLSTEARQVRTAANTAYKQDTTLGIDNFSGEAITFNEYMALYFPEYEQKMARKASLAPLITQLSLSVDGALEGTELELWRNGSNKAESASVSYPSESTRPECQSHASTAPTPLSSSSSSSSSSWLMRAQEPGSRVGYKFQEADRGHVPSCVDYNMPVMIADADTVTQVATGQLPAGSFIASYEAAYTIGGSYNTVAKAWSDSFPQTYPNSRTEYLAGASRYVSDTMSSTNNSWSNLGYSSTTTATHAGWFIFSYRNSQTNTVETLRANISTSDFSTGVSVSAWGIGMFPVGRGLWCKWCLFFQLLP
jgi:hypothetical protein